MKLSRLLTWIVVLLATGYLSFKLIFLPNYARSLNYGSDVITIARDQYNIPHIKAHTKAGAFYALGYASAEDRLFQMHIKRMVSEGRLSEMFGQKSLAVDKMFRTIGIGYYAREAAQKFLKEAKPQYVEIYQAYTKGINDYANNAVVLPLEFLLTRAQFRPWTIEDCFAINGLLNWGQSFDHQMELIRSFLAVNHTRQQIDIILPFKESFVLEADQVIVNDEELKKAGFFQDATTRNRTHVEFSPEHINSLVDMGINQFMESPLVGASNSWVIGGKLTASGKPIMANDPHLETSIPSEWYQFSLEYSKEGGKNYSIKGAAIAGSLANIVGKTDYVAWGCTNVYTDTQDLYKEKLDESGQNYMYNGQWRKLQTRQEVILIKWSEPLLYKIRSTHRGPLMEQIFFSTHLYEIKEPISLAWTAAHSRYQFYVQAIDFLEVDNYHDLKVALRESLNDAPPINFIFITRDGHIGLQNIGSYPIMNNQAEQSGYIKDGTTSKHDWIGMLKGKDRMFIEDPEKGYIVTANNRLTTNNFRGGRYESNWLITARAIRINEIIQHKIQKGHKFTIEDNKLIQLDTVDYFCRKGLPHLIKLAPEFKRAFEYFDCNFTSESSEASLYSMFIWKLQRRLKPVDVPIEGTNTFNHFTYRTLLAITVDDTEELENIKKALEEAKSELETFFMTKNQEAWAWGKLHRDLMEHRPFSQTPLAWFFQKNFPGRGNQNTPNVAMMRKLGFGKWEVNHRAGIRMVLTFEKNQSEWIIDSGSSQNVLSKHYDDQYYLFKSDQYIPFDTVNEVEQSDL